jgi:aminomethyltransferase
VRQLPPLRAVSRRDRVSEEAGTRRRMTAKHAILGVRARMPGRTSLVDLWPGGIRLARVASLQWVTSSTLKRTPLFECHREAGAKLVPFAGWEMPVQYADGIRSEHLAVRNRAGIFDVSHMGEVACSGPGAEDFLQRVVSNDVSKMAIGSAQYALLCNADGGVLDDLFTYRLGPASFLTVTNAANHEADVAWMRAHAAGFEVEVEDVASSYAMLAVQGPVARELVQAIADGPLPARMTAARGRVLGRDMLICGTGYTGEDGVELLADPEDAPAIWDEIVRRGAVPAGLAARDTLRLEACFHLYGNDLSADRNPIEAGLGWACKEDTGFIGAEAVRAAREAGPEQKLVPFKLTGSGIARQGNPVAGGGVVTSGTMSPCLGIGIGMAYLPAERANPGIEFEIDVRGKTRRAVVATKPLYDKETDG